MRPNTLGPLRGAARAAAPARGGSRLHGSPRGAARVTAVHRIDTCSLAPELAVALAAEAQAVAACRGAWARGRAALLANLYTWHPEPFRYRGHLLT